jgi:carbonic anhydrase
VTVVTTYFVFCISSKGAFAMSNSSCYASDLTVGSLPGRADRPEAGTRPQSLWIACTDLVMDGALKRFQEDASIVVWRQFGNRVPTPAWTSGQTSCSLNDAVERWGIRDIVVCGHSMCSGFSAVRSGDGQSESPGGIDVLLQRVRQREAMNERAREHVVQQLAVLEEQPAIAHAMSLGNLQLYGLFYLAESGLFTRYDKASGQFVAIHD